MLQTVKKRDGRIVGYTEEKVKCALRKAMYETDKGVDEALIQKITDKVTMNEASTLGVEDIQDIIEKELLKSARKDVAKLYITYRHKRDVARKAKTREIFFEIINAEKNDITRENANMNADTPAGMMMKFASETTKPFVNDYLLADDVREAFEGNYIHIHDADMYPSKSLTCLEGNTNITIMLEDGHPMFTEMKYFDQFFDSEPTQDPTLVIFDSSDEDIMIEGRNGWTRVLNVSRRYMSDEDTFFRLGNENTEEELHVTGTHQIPVVDKNDGLTILKTVYEIQIGDLLIKDGLDQLVEVTFKDEINKDGIIVYDIETEDHYFVANGYVVHNCVQHPLDKILNDGFMAGHGESRPAKRIETASVISCISMETAQNEMHGGQAIPAFDFYMAPFVRKTYIEEIKKIEDLMGEDLSELYDADIKDYETKELDGLKGTERYKQQAINQTVQRVHQAMEAFIHNMNSIHCVHGDEKIWVHDAFDDRVKAMTIREVCDNFREKRFKVLSINQDSSNIEWKYIYDASYQGTKDVYTVKGKGGRAVHVTDNHRISTVRKKGKIEFDYPKEITNFIVPKVQIDDVYHYGYHWDLTKFTSRKTQNYTLPYVEVTSELCEMLGMFVADGCVMGDGTLAFSVCDEELNQRLIHLMQKVYNEDITWTITSYGKPKKVHQIRFNVGKVWGNNIVDLCGGKTKAKRIPYFVLGGDKEMMRSFLRGYLICDGSIKQPLEGYYEAGTISDTLSKELDFLYLRHGEYPYIHERQMYGYEDKTKVGNIIHEISFSGMSNERMRLGFEVYAETEYRKYNHDLTTEQYFVEDIDEVELYEENAPVYDIAVEDNENFLTASNVIIHNSRGGNQVVFSSINYGTDTSAEGRCVIRELLKSTYRGVGNGSTAIFPIQIWKKKRGVSYLPEDPNYDLYKLACKVTARRFFPNFLNLDATFNQDSDWDANDPKRYEHEVACMGCRTRVFENRFGPKTSIGRGNLSFTTINIVKLAIECMNIEKKDERINMFFAKLDHMLDIAAKQLNDRFEFQKTALVKQFPLLMSKLWIGSEKLSPNDTIESVINQGTLGIGFIGLAECLIALIGKHHGESEEAQELGLKIITYMRDRVNDFCEKYQHNYSVLATPAEGLSGKFTKKDRKQFGVIPGVTDKEYYTNSNHVPVYYHCSPRHKAEIESPYHNITRGGHIFYVEIDGDATHNPEAIMNIVDLMDEYNIGYGSVNHNRNRCMDCGYEDATEGLKVCPKCGSTHIDTLQRITGYLVGTTDRWNSGKIAELNDRVVHK